MIGKVAGDVAAHVEAFGADASTNGSAGPILEGRAAEVASAEAVVGTFCALTAVTETASAITKRDTKD